ncbi:MAG TPA: hypothetical protein VHZ09_13890 [Acidobacteriaceae bacterium]|jgi:hypothetical protein|nr:hypothetical protein [Acidobacteriaceae bacterium]
MTPTPMQPADEEARAASDPCSTTIDPTAPAGSPHSLGAKSDCGGRPATDHSVVEAKDEMGPGVGPAAGQVRDSGR